MGIGNWEAKMKKRGYGSVTEMAKALGGKKFGKEVEENIKENQLSKHLFIMRCKAGVSQKEMAKRLNCTQGKISKIEHTCDANMKIKDLMAYSKALESHIIFSFVDNKMNITDKIKFHAFIIKGYLDQLAAMAHKDKELYKGVYKFFQGALFNLTNIVKTSAKKLPQHTETETQIFEVASPVEEVNHEKVCV